MLLVLSAGAVLRRALLVLRQMAAWCALPLGVSACVIVVTPIVVGEPVPFEFGVSACLAVLETLKYVLLGSLKVSVVMAHAVLFCGAPLSSAVGGSPTVMSEGWRAAVVPLRVVRLQIGGVSQRSCVLRPIVGPGHRCVCCCRHGCRPRLCLPSPVSIRDQIIVV